VRREYKWIGAIDFTRIKPINFQDENSSENNKEIKGKCNDPSG
jgi:hypothetical protein